MSEKSKPEPAVGQVWRRDGSEEEMVVGSADDPWKVRCTDGDYVTRAGLRLCWSCVGVVTEHGRVMVGERRVSDHRTSDTPTVTVARVTANGYVAVRPDGATFEVGYDAARVAQWPVMPGAFGRVSFGGVEVPCIISAVAEPVYAGGECIGKTRGRWEAAPMNIAATFRGEYESDSGATFAAAKRIAETTPVSYDNAIRAVEYYGSEEAARMAIASVCAGGAAPLASVCSGKVTAEDVKRIVEALKVTPRPKPAPPDPRAERERRRRETDAVLADDARRYPAFATARKCAVMAAYEAQRNLCEDRATADGLLAMLQRREVVRGSARWWPPGVDEEVLVWGSRNGTGNAARAAIAAYERARAL